MANPTELYSYQGKEPQLLPQEISWQESWGAVTYRTGVDNFTEEEIEKAGYSGPYTKPEYDETTHFLVWNTEELNWEINEIIKEPLFVSEQHFLQELRNRRNLLLTQTDWTQVADCQLSDTKKQEFLTYRQELRDFPELIKLDVSKYMEDPNTIEWPIIP